MAANIQNQVLDTGVECRIYPDKVPLAEALHFGKCELGIRPIVSQSPARKREQVNPILLERIYSGEQHRVTFGLGKGHTRRAFLIWTLISLSQV